MRLSPALDTLRVAVRRLVESIDPQTTAVYLIGFDWLPYHQVIEPLGGARARLTLLSKQVDRCWRALLYVEPCADGISKVTVLLIGGGGFYTMNLHHDTGTAAPQFVFAE